MIKGKFEKASTFPLRTLLSYSLPLLGLNFIGIFQNWADIALLYAFTSNLSTTGIYYVVASSAGVLGYLVLRRIIQLKFTEALPKSLAVTIATAIPLGITDFYLAQYLSAALVTRAIIAALLFTLLFTATTRRIRLLNDSDFNLFKQAFPKPLHTLIDFAKNLLIPSPRSPSS
jgi:O-antigen/teichoic acid export membrane protein